MISIIGAVIIYLNSPSWLWIDKHAKTLGGLIVPWSYVINSVKTITEQQEKLKVQTLLPNASFENNDKAIVVLVIGETARSHNFSLYGYGIQTNPKLSKTDIFTLENTKSCSTYTTASIECMLSHTKNNSSQYEPLPSYLKRHDVDVIWRTANWGEPKIDVTSYETRKDLRPVCKGEDCQFDGVLLTGLLDKIKASKKNKVFVTLHTKGSHGPAYNKRYPKSFEKFTPVCESVELDKCSSQELINAYDNSILYTDDFLHKLIQQLSEFNDIPVLMMYISDHGESLGEYGLYLHGTPYSIAPDFQKDIPFLMWMSDKYKNSKNYKSADYSFQNSFTQNHIFHTVMGAFNMNSNVYKKNLDLSKYRLKN